MNFITRGFYFENYNVFKIKTGRLLGFRNVVFALNVKNILSIAHNNL